MAKKQPIKPAISSAASSQVNLPVQPPAKQMFPVNLKLALLLAFIAFAVYANSIRNGYVLDDGGAISENTIVAKGVSAIPEILSTPYHKGFFTSQNDLYRPLSLVMFAVEYQLFGLNPMPNHLINVLLFAACVVLLFLFLDKFLKGNTAVAFIAALLFALHPVHTEVVANIKSRDELLCFFFAFLSLNVFTNYMHTGKNGKLILASAFFFLSLLSKETTVVFVAVIPLFFFIYRNENRKRGIYIAVCTVFAALVFLAIRFSVLGAYNANHFSKINFIDNALANKDISFESRIATAVLILGYYIKLLFVPYPLICDYSYDTIPFVHFSDPEVLLVMAVYIVLIVFGLRCFFKDHKDPYAFAIFFFLIMLLPFSNILFLIGTTMGERLLFFPSVGFCVAAALLILKLGDQTERQGVQFLKSKKILAIIIPVCIAYGFVTINRNSDWADKHTLYTTDLKKAPRSAKLNYWIGLDLIRNYGNEEKDTVKQRQYMDEGIGYLNKSLAIYPGFADAEFELFGAYYVTRQYDSAEVHGLKAVSFDSTSFRTQNLLGGVYFFQKKYPQAIAWSKNVIRLNPGYVRSYLNIAKMYLLLNEFDSSIHYSYSAIAIDPSVNGSYEFLAKAYSASGKLDSARKYEGIARMKNPDFRSVP